MARFHGDKPRQYGVDAQFIGAPAIHSRQKRIGNSFDHLTSVVAFDKFGNRLPNELRQEHEKLSRRLSTEGASLARSG